MDEDEDEATSLRPVVAAVGRLRDLPSPSPSRAELARRLEALRAPDQPTRKLVEVGGWLRGSQFARGGSARLCHALRIEDGLHAAHKQFADQDRDPTAIHRCHDEVGILARIHHANVVAMYDYGRHEGLPWLALEYVRHDLRSRLETGRPAVELLLRWIVELLSALDAAHQLGIVHRDIKPRNILITDDDHVKLTDFGVAKQAREETLTGTGETYGTPGFMAPEQLVREQLHRVGPRTDIFSVGVVMNFLFTGVEPELPIGSVITALAPMGGPLGDIVSRATAPDPDDRFVDAMAMARVVSDYAEGLA